MRAKLTCKDAADVAFSKLPAATLRHLLGRASSPFQVSHLLLGLANCPHSSNPAIAQLLWLCDATLMVSYEAHDVARELRSEAASMAVLASEGIANIQIIVEVPFDCHWQDRELKIQASIYHEAPLIRWHLYTLTTSIAP